MKEKITEIGLKLSEIELLEVRQLQITLASSILVQYGLFFQPVNQNNLGYFVSTPLKRALKWSLVAASAMQWLLWAAVLPMIMCSSWKGEDGKIVAIILVAINKSTSYCFFYHVLAVKYYKPSLLGWDSTFLEWNNLLLYNKLFIVIN